MKVCIPSFSEACAFTPSLDGSELAVAATGGNIAGRSRCVDDTGGSCESVSGSCEEAEFSNDFFLTFFGAFPEWSYEVKIKFIAYKYYSELEALSGGGCQWSGFRTGEEAGRAEVSAELLFEASDFDGFCRVQKKFGVTDGGKLAENAGISLDYFTGLFPECEKYGILLVSGGAEISPKCQS